MEPPSVDHEHRTLGIIFGILNSHDALQLQTKIHPLLFGDGILFAWISQLRPKFTSINLIPSRVQRQILYGVIHGWLVALRSREC